MDLYRFAWSFLSRDQLKQADDAIRVLLWSGGLDAEESRVLVRLHWRLQREILERRKAAS
jgi:hypothetical protein